ncbi:ly6/PLAUR domain-containing protein 6-like [Engraulis encrasicolus]|uniref:ly6/PLAUR domain-containing protein 6-like n=1 Tax=Engraulis encrasicolus TaxID=184585 RepID=UPI002FD3C9D7
MHPWPKVAWVLLLTLLSDWLESALCRDFSVKDIVFLHPSTTPYPGGFKCFTCENAADNFDCNRWAPDIYCPQETRYCYTEHKMTEAGDSVTVTKRCVALEECLYTGCTDVLDEGHKVCTSCCEGNICNMPVPRNETSAVFATVSPLNRSSSLFQQFWGLWLSTLLLNIIIMNSHS